MGTVFLSVRSRIDTDTVRIGSLDRRPAAVGTSSAESKQEKSRKKRMWMGDIVETNRSLLDDEFVDPLKMESSWWPSSNPGAFSPHSLLKFQKRERLLGY